MERPLAVTNGAQAEETCIFRHWFGFRLSPVVMSRASHHLSWLTGREPVTEAGSEMVGFQGGSLEETGSPGPTDLTEEHWFPLENKKRDVPYCYRWKGWSRPTACLPSFVSLLRERCIFPLISSASAAFIQMLVLFCHSNLSFLFLHVGGNENKHTHKSEKGFRKKVAQVKSRAPLHR